jgi:hypothetical protein
MQYLRQKKRVILCAGGGSDRELPQALAKKNAFRHLHLARSEARSRAKSQCDRHADILCGRDPLP